MILFVLNVGASAQPDSLYLQAGNAYSDGAFEHSLELYRQINDAGYEAADLYFNMGNAAFRSNKLGYAILYYEKALKLDPRHEDARANLAYVSMYREDQLESVPQFFLHSWFEKLFLLFSIKTWSAISILLFTLLLAGVLLYIFGQRLVLKKSGFSISLVALLTFTLSIIATINRHHMVTQPDRAVIIEPSVIVKSSPSQSGNDLFILHEGTRVSTEDAVGEWVEIKISDGRVGWMPLDQLESI